MNCANARSTGPLATATVGWCRQQLWVGLGCRTRRRAGAGCVWKHEREGREWSNRRKRAGGEQEEQEEEEDDHKRGYGRKRRRRSR